MCLFTEFKRPSVRIAAGNVVARTKAKYGVQPYAVNTTKIERNVVGPTS